MSVLVLLVAVVIAVGLVGVIVPMLPGSFLVAAAIGIWAVVENNSTAWLTFAAAALLIAAGTVIKYLIPGRRLQRSGVPNSSLLIGAIVGVVGFFVIPVVGLPLGFVSGIYLNEWRRTTQAAAGPATWNAVKAVGLGMAIEFGFSVAAAAVWVIGVVAG